MLAARNSLRAAAVSASGLGIGGAGSRGIVGRCPRKGSGGVGGGSDAVALRRQAPKGGQDAGRAPGGHRQQRETDERMGWMGALKGVKGELRKWGVDRGGGGGVAIVGWWQAPAFGCVVGSRA